MDVGYGADDPALMLIHWKFYLRAVTNAIIDARIHATGMTEDEAVALMVDGGFQEEAEARAKYDRARLSSTQLSTYFAGSLEMWDIELEARRRAAVASGDPRGAAPSRSRGSSAASATRRASSTGRISSRSSPTARRRPRCSGGSCSAEPRRRAVRRPLASARRRLGRRASAAGGSAAEPARAGRPGNRPPRRPRTGGPHGTSGRVRRGPRVDRVEARPPSRGAPRTGRGRRTRRLPRC